jgi:hypothetical protein
MQARRRAGLSSSPCRLRQYLLIQRQIGNCTTKTTVLGLQILQPLHLIRLQPTKLMAPAILRHLRHPNRADRLRDRLALREQHIDLS